MVSHGIAQHTKHACSESAYFASAVRMLSNDQQTEHRSARHVKPAPAVLTSHCFGPRQRWKQNKSSLKPQQLNNPKYKKRRPKVLSRNPKLSLSQRLRPTRLPELPLATSISVSTIGLEPRFGLYFAKFGDHETSAGDDRPKLPTRPIMPLHLPPTLV